MMLKLRILFPIACLIILVFSPSIAEEDGEGGGEKKTTVSSGIEPNTTVKELKIESAIQAYKSSAESADVIVTKVLDQTPSRVLVTTKRELRSDAWLYTTTLNSLKLLNKKYDELIEKSDDFLKVSDASPPSIVVSDLLRWSH